MVMTFISDIRLRSIDRPAVQIKSYVWFTTNCYYKVCILHFNPKNILVDVVAYFEHTLISKCDIELGSTKDSIDFNQG
jgi:hypothetical protein